MKYKASFILFVSLVWLCFLHISKLMVKGYFYPCVLHKPVRRSSIVYSGDIYGKWEPGASEEKTCIGDHYYGCCLEQEQNAFHFVFHKLQPKDISARTSFENKIQNKNIVLIGDSTVNQLDEGLCEFLQIHNRSIRIIKHGDKGKTIIRKTPHRHNGTISYIMAHIFLFKNSETHGKINFVNEKILQEAVHENDIIVFSIGIHYRSLMSLAELHSHIQNVSKFIWDAAANRDKNIVIRSTLPTHFVSRFKTGIYQGKFGVVFFPDNNCTFCILLQNLLLQSLKMHRKILREHVCFLTQIYPVGLKYTDCCLLHFVVIYYVQQKSIQLIGLWHPSNRHMSQAGSVTEGLHWFSFAWLTLVQCIKLVLTRQALWWCNGDHMPFIFVLSLFQPKQQATTIPL